MTDKKITVIGAGNSGLVMASHLAYYEYNICLWNRSEETINKILKTKTIYLNGQITAKVKISHVTTSIQEALKDSEIILITTPANSHYDLAKIIAPYIEKNSLIILNPGRTFGALEFLNTLISENCKNIPSICETQTIIYTCRKTAEDKVSLLAFKNSVLISCINSKIEAIMGKLPNELQKYMKPTENFLQTSLGNVGMILHCAPVLLNTGWIENKKHKFRYYYEGITPIIAGFLEKIDNERLAVASKFGVKIRSVSQWLNESYDVHGKNLYESIQQVESYSTIDAPESLMHRYLFEDICTGLVPIEALGKKLGLEMKNTSLIIDLATEMLNYDFRFNGRNEEKLKLIDKNFNCLNLFKI